MTSGTSQPCNQAFDLFSFINKIHSQSFFRDQKMAEWVLRSWLVLRDYGTMGSYCSYWKSEVLCCLFFCFSLIFSLMARNYTKQVVCQSWLPPYSEMCINIREVFDNKKS